MNKEDERVPIVLVRNTPSSGSKTTEGTHSDRPRRFHLYNTPCKINTKPKKKKKKKKKKKTKKKLIVVGKNCGY